MSMHTIARVLATISTTPHSQHYTVCVCLTLQLCLGLETATVEELMYLTLVSEPRPILW